MELIVGLPEEIGFECLTRLHYSSHRVASQVCKRWKGVLESSEFYNERKRSGFTRKLACFVQSHSVPLQPEGSKPLSSVPSFGISAFDFKSLSWERLSPIPKYPSGIPFFSQLSSVQGKLVVMGGWNPVSWDPVSDVFVYDFTTQIWRQGKDMPSRRSLFASAAINGKIFISGGHDENKNALKSAWSYDVMEDEWNELTQMNEPRDECQGIVVENEFCVVSGYGTEEQGKFQGSAEFYNLETDQWRRVDGVWIEGKSPRGSVSVNKDGNFVCLSQVDSVVSVGVCGVDLGELTLLTGSAYQGATPGFYFLEESPKLQKIEVQNDFCGFVQSGCCVEV